MHAPAVVTWLLTGVFLVLTLPCVHRLVRLDYLRSGEATRQGDLAELLLVVAMVAMVSPIGGPIPAAGWQAVLAVLTGWLLWAWLRPAPGQGRLGAHHAVSAAAALYMISAMPHSGVTHGPWMTMAGPGVQGGPAWPVLALAAAYFAHDALRSGVAAVRGATGRVAAPDGAASRAACRSVMGLGMASMFALAL
jgi:hypothetical protein